MAISRFQQEVVRFWSKVEKSDGCWNWTGCLKSGYGAFNVIQEGKKKMINAHRYAYWLSFGPIESGLCVCHKCDNPRCVNPDHLFAGTQADNIADMDRKGRRDCRRGDKNGNSKLTAAQVVEIRFLAASLPQQEIADQFGVTKTHISRILRGAAWAD